MLSREAMLQLRKAIEEGRPILLVPTDKTAEFFEELRNALGEEEDDDE